MEVTKLQLYSANQGKGLRFTTYIGSSAKVTYLTLGKKKEGRFFFLPYIESLAPPPWIPLPISPFFSPCSLPFSYSASSWVL